MIGRLSGRLALKGLDHVMIDVGGVGYVVHVSDRTLATLPGPGEAVSLWTEMLVREDLMQLMGFVTVVEKEWFRLLTSVQGVGAKSALGILGALGPDGVSRAIALGDWSAVKAAPGVGPKIAQRVVNELKDKAPGVMAMGAGAPSMPVAQPADPGEVIETPALVTPAPAPGGGAAQAEALSALGNLGYGPSEAARAVAEAAGADPQADTAALIRAALRLLAPKG